MKKKYAAGKAGGSARIKMFMNGKLYCFEFLPSTIILRQENPGEGVISRYRIKGGKCSCLAFATYEGPCKHILALRKLKEQIQLSLSAE